MGIEMHFILVKVSFVGQHVQLMGSMALVDLG